MDQGTISFVNEQSSSYFMNKAVHLIITGGTIDATWDGRQDTAVVAEHSIIPDYIGKLSLYAQVKFTEVCMKDSRALTPEDVKKVLDTIENCEEEKIIITHGTYTMPDTARYIKANLKRKGVTVVLTGAMTPLKGFDMSDASFNLGYAFSQVQNLEPEVYLCMNGRTFSSEEVAKSMSEGKFYSVFADKQ